MQMRWCGIEGGKCAGRIESERHDGKRDVRGELGHAIPTGRVRKLAGDRKGLMGAAGELWVRDRLAGAVAITERDGNVIRRRGAWIRRAYFFAEFCFAAPSIRDWVSLEQASSII